MVFANLTINGNPHFHKNDLSYHSTAGTFVKSGPFKFQKMWYNGYIV